MPRDALRLLIFLSMVPGRAGPAEPFLTTPLSFAEQVVVSDSAVASKVGARILDEGGNAVDAAVATAFALAVVHPAAGNIGGGGFLVARLPDGSATCFDFREKAPLDAKADMFLDTAGRYDPTRHHDGILSVGVPGTVAGLHVAHQRLGRLPWPRLVQPAVDLAEGGTTVTRGLAESLEEALPRMRPYPATLAQFTRDGKPFRVGDVIVQRDLARTLARIRDLGPTGFYEGETAELILREMRRRGGLFRQEDLGLYRAVERKPLSGSYRGLEVISMPPPSSGGVALVEILNILEGYDLAALGLRGSRSVHLMVEAMRRAFADRARYLGDPDRVEIPVGLLSSKDHAAALRKAIDPLRASRSSASSFDWPRESPQTTHVSALDVRLEAVSLTITLEQSFGSCIVVEGAGFLLNNEMGDFNAKAGLTDHGGLIGTAPNLVEPEKRMLSSMTPTIVVKDGRPALIIGSPGGRTIINTVLEVIVNVFDYGMSIQEAIDQPRFHHQWLPDRIIAEPRCFSPDTRAALEAMGHTVENASSPQGSAMGIMVLGGKDPTEPMRIEAGVDMRRPDGGAAGR